MQDPTPQAEAGNQTAAPIIVTIRRRWTDAVLYTHQTTADRQASRLAMRDALEAANKARANLAGANLDGANLAGAYLAGANLARANLAGAYLDGANLAGAYLARAYLARANLARANLAGANLAGANLDGANLAGAYLDGANLDGANLDGANLARANLDGANLDGAYLARANLARANLAGANLAGAYLDGANLDGSAKLAGSRPILMIGPIGSRAAYLCGYVTDQGVKVRAGCFFGSLDEFRAAVADEHGDNEHGREYAAAIAMIEAHAAIWPAPAVQPAAEAA